MVVPKDLQKFVGKKELRYTLKTGYAGIARQKARFVAGKVHFIFRTLRRGATALIKLTDDQIKELIDQYIKQAIKSWDELFCDDVDKDEYPRPYVDEDTFHGYLRDLDFIRGDLVTNLNLGDFSMLKLSIHDLLKKNGITDPDTNAPEYRKLSAEIHKAEIQLIPFQKRHMLCDFSYKKELPEVFPEVFAKEHRPVDQPDAKKSEPLSKVIRDYWKEKERTWKPRSKTEIKRALDHLEDRIGSETPIHIIDGPMMRTYKQNLREEEIKPGKTRSIKTINDKYLCFIKTFFSYAKDNSYIKENPAEGVIIKDNRKRKAHSLQDVFTTEDLTKLFCESPEYRKDELQAAHYFWIPLIGLYTGMREEEICQLYVSDLKEISGTGIYYFDALEEEDKPDKSIKTGQRRSVPLHPFLSKELNFVGFVNSLPDHSGRIFPETNRVANRYGHYFSMWFGRFRKRCLVNVKPRRKTFHSFRHTLKTHLAERGVDYVLNNYLTGHTTQDVAARYIKPKPEMLYKSAVLKIDYGIDLSHLKRSKWVPK